jgi:phage-related protein
VAWSVVYFTDAAGAEPVREFIDALNPRQRQKLLRSVQLLEEFGTQLPQPHAKFLGEGLWELRTQVEGDAFRVLYCGCTRQRFVLLHAFQKKTQKTPARELDTAKRRRIDWLARNR